MTGDDPDDAPASISTSCASWVLAVPFCATMFVFTYVGLAEFFYSVCLVIITFLTSLISYRCAGSSEFWQLILTFIWAMPLFEPLLGICADIFLNFFRSFASLLDLSAMSVWVFSNVRFTAGAESSLARLWRLTLVGLMSGVVVVTLILITWGILDAVRGHAIEFWPWLAPVVSAAALSAPAIAFLRLLLSGWLALLRRKPGREARQLPDLDPPGRTPRLKNPFDPCRITAQREWRDFLGVRDGAGVNCLLDMRREGCSVSRVLAVVFAVALGAAIILLDVMRERESVRVDRQRRDYLDAALPFVRGEGVARNWSWIEDWNPAPPTVRLRSISRVMSTIELIARVLMIVVATPFVIASNLLVVYTRGRELPRRVRRSKIVGQVLLALGIGSALAGVGLELGLTNRALTDYVYEPPTGRRVTADHPAGFCYLDFNGINVIGVAGLPMVFDAIPRDIFVGFDSLSIGVANDFSTQSFGFGWLQVADGMINMSELAAAEALYRQVFDLREYPEPIPPGGACEEFATFNGTCRRFPQDVGGCDFLGARFGYAYPPGRTGMSMVLAVQSAERKTEIGLLVENVAAHWFRLAMKATIPMLTLVEKIFLSDFLTDLTEGLMTAALGPVRLSSDWAVIWNIAGAVESLWFDLYAREADETNEQHAPALAFGHGAAGLVSKAIAREHGWVGVAAEAPEFDRSPLSGFFGQRPESYEESIFNIYSGTTLLAMAEARAKLNIVLPSWQELWAPATQEQTFCLLAAGCAEDDRYDSLCAKLVGTSRFRDYFESWGRPRTD
jgi:hypothetical protein